MKLNITLAEGEQVVAALVQTVDGRLELREQGIELTFDEAVAIVRDAAAAPLPRSFALPSVTVVADELGHDVGVEVRRGEVLAHLENAQCVVPLSWPRGIEVAAVAYIGHAGSLVLDEPRCLTCGGTGKSPVTPPGWVGPGCPVCEGTGEYVVKAAPTGDAGVLPEALP